MSNGSNNGTASLATGSSRIKPSGYSPCASTAVSSLSVARAEPVHEMQYKGQYPLIETDTSTVYIVCADFVREHIKS